eukprot:3658997-Amphidinium_carterae.1
MPARNITKRHMHTELRVPRKLSDSNNKPSRIHERQSVSLRSCIVTPNKNKPGWQQLDRKAASAKAHNAEASLRDLCALVEVWTTPCVRKAKDQGPAQPHKPGAIRKAVSEKAVVGL